MTPKLLADKGFWPRWPEAEGFGAICPDWQDAGRSAEPEPTPDYRMQEDRRSQHQPPATGYRKTSGARSNPRLQNTGRSAEPEPSRNQLIPLILADQIKGRARFEPMELFRIVAVFQLNHFFGAIRVFDLHFDILAWS